MERVYTSKSLEDAKEQAYKEFESEGADRDEVEITVLEQPVKKLFGAKGDYKISASWTPIDTDVKAIFNPQDDDKNPKISRPKTTEDASHILGCDKIVRAKKYLTMILEHLGCSDFTIDSDQKGDLVVLDIKGDNLGVIIGRRGETLDALQYLAILAGNKGEESYYRISVDCCGYREKRRDALETLAYKTAKKVLKTGRRITLEPMNPYERRIIHSKISELEGVTSRSVGDEPFRKVVISGVDNRKTGGGRKPQNQKGGSYNGTGSYRQSSGFSTSFEREYKRGEHSSPKTSSYSDETEEFEKSVSLYGKIEL